MQLGLVAAAAVCGLALILDTVSRSSATYDEVAYLRVASRWWRTGEQQEITRMGSPLLFWKLQQAPVLWALDRLGPSALIDDPMGHQAALLPLVRAGSAWIWLVSLGLTVWWARRLYGPGAMVLAAWLFALSPNLIAHGGLVTMELPLIAATTAMFFLFWSFRRSGRQRWLWASAAAGGVAFSCKFTAVLIPPILAVVWWTDAGRRGEGTAWGRTRGVLAGMLAYVLVMIVSNLVVTGFATLPLSPRQHEHPSIEARFGPRLAPWIARLVETPLPQDWTGFVIQMHHQGSGGSSYLLGERRMRGWWYYYLVALAVKVPLGCWLLLAGRAALGSGLREARSDRESKGDLLLPLGMGLFLAVAAAGSSRNYGLRYLLPMAPLAIVWVSRLGAGGLPFRWPGWVVSLGLLGQVGAIASCHPHELTYFNELAGGRAGGRRVLADSNLDWGQGLRALAQLQRLEPRFRDLTVYYFGDTDPAWYGVAGTAHVVNAVGEHAGLPPLGEVGSRYLAVSASLQWGPWGPPGFFRALEGIEPERVTADTTIAIYRTADLMSKLAWRPRGPID